ncbi:glyoxylate reductase/hydroxypyruvate reductase-like isoform X2 [Chrysoperla carnea]|nr:glyoxylate reductase/hydroxypyruvate reductase-like isoform X2 [Chrysoperla carnea]XP_044740129.1 glyoxylate reductase/hydroxypyruvate reductase-like isoform X2 [Chrysoperla carnea]
MSTSRPKVFIKDPDLPEEGLEILKSRCELIRGAKDNSMDDLAKMIQEANGVDAIMWSGHGVPNKEILDAAGPNLKIFASVSAGVDHLNISEIKSRGVLISNTPGVLNAAVAESAVLLTLGAARRIEEGRRAIVNGEWKTNFNWLLGTDLVGSTVGIVGLGGIGMNVARRLKAFDVGRIIYNGHKPKPAGDEIGAIFVPSLNELLKESDFIIVAVPLTKETALMFNKTTFAQMKKNAVFVNVGRGGLVNHDDLVEALKTNTIFAAGLDVMTPEPLPVDHPLLKLPNCVLMPHLGSATVKTRIGMANLASKNVLAALDNKPLITPVN